MALSGQGCLLEMLEGFAWFGTLCMVSQVEQNYLVVWEIFIFEQNFLEDVVPPHKEIGDSSNSPAL